LIKVNKNSEKHQPGKSVKVKISTWMNEKYGDPTQLILSTPIYLGSPVTFLF
jgi:hypothetical protein